MDVKSSSLPGSKRARTRDQLLVSAQLLLMEQNAAALGLRRITDHAGLVHASFYNYYPDIGGLIGDLGELLGATHAAAMAELDTANLDVAARFALITRQTLRMVAGQPGFGRLMFDVGLPIDSLSSELRLRLKLDIAEGVARGMFKVSDIDIATSMVAGAISGLALDLHRGSLPVAAIDAATSALLVQLGLDRQTSEQLGHAPVDFPPPPELPMRWLALPPVALGETR
ncbi:TetR/AcrR family transcriptional regulator [Polymorphobacter arshaanensis]|uniref:TetR/AcrR family transcriptional regulator n=1 Tax=Glacieibacterium arshaanense TaxID=2511025 RepID=A0A4Y9ER68_9SPHN|nr:TetR/AcrR family transcriptional regulator [Polymorphobacter arshaanensis]TFU06094.1 TetR/AcrR family transcriptional regulator [Polymorphobacter arshaanensis]